MTAPVLDPFEQALRAELQGVTPPDGIGVVVDDVIASGRRTRTRRRLTAAVSALVVVALVALGTALHGAREEAVPATPEAPAGLTLLTPPEGEVAPSYGVTVGTGSPAVPSQAAATTATVWSKASGRWTRVVDVPLDAGLQASQWVELPRSTLLVGFVPSAAARRAVVSRTGAATVSASVPTTPVAGSSWSAFVVASPWRAADPSLGSSPTDIVWWSADRIPVDEDGRRGSVQTVDGIPCWVDASEHLWGYQSGDAVVAFPVEAGRLSGSQPTGDPTGVVWTALVPPDVPAGTVEVRTASGRRLTGVVGRLGALGVLVTRSTGTQDPVVRVEWTEGGRQGSFALHDGGGLATFSSPDTVGG